MFGNTNLLTYDFTISVFLTQYSHYQVDNVNLRLILQMRALKKQSF
jgi:hypothetical protein